MGKYSCVLFLYEPIKCNRFPYKYVNRMVQKMENNIRDLNEQVANLYVAKVMAFIAAVVIAVVFMNIIGFFEVNQVLMNIACGNSFIALLIPIFILKVLKKNEPWLKYVAICSASFVLLSITVTLNYLIIIMFVFPMALASIYFNPKLNRIALFLSIIMSTVGRVLAFKLNPGPDLNFPTWYGLIVFSIVPTVLMLTLIGTIFSALANNTNEMMSSLMNAEEQEKIFNHMKKLSEKSSEVSKGLLEGMKTLGEVTHNSMKANEEIADNTVTVVDGIQSSMKQLNIAESNSSQIYESVQELAVEIRKLSQQTQKTLNDVREIIGELLEQNTIAVNAMNQTSSVHEEQKEVILKAEQSAQGVMLATKEMTEKMQLISNNTKHIEQSTGEIVDIVNMVTNICKENQEALDVVAASVETGSTSMQQLEEVVGSIREMSDELAIVVQS